MTDTNLPTGVVTEEILNTLSLKRQSLKPHQINWNINQRKRRRNARRAFAAGNRNAFN